MDGSVTISLRNFVGKGIIKAGKLTGPNKVYLILGWRTGAQREDCCARGYHLTMK
jgi:hypothetical protein